MENEKINGLTEHNYIKGNFFLLIAVLFLSYSANVYMLGVGGNWLLALWGISTIFFSFPWLARKTSGGAVLAHLILLFFAVVGLLSMTSIIN